MALVALLSPAQAQDAWKETDLDYLLTLSLEQVRALVPLCKPITSWGKFPLEGYARWHPQRPREVTIKGETLIPEERFPPTSLMVLTGPQGERHEYPYFTDSLGNPLYPTVVTDRAARDFFVTAVQRLTARYAERQERQAALVALAILHRLAEAYRGYPIYGRLSQRGRFAIPEQEPYPETTGKWQDWYYQLDPIEPGLLARSYAVLRQTAVVDELAAALGRDVRADIEEYFFLDLVRLVQRYDGWMLAAGRALNDNLMPARALGLARIARALEQPEVFHYAFENLADILQARFMVDGVFPESPGYHGTALNPISEAAVEMTGYSDPPHYQPVPPRSRYDHLRPEAIMPLLARAREFRQVARYPDGRLWPVHDTPGQSVGTPSTETVSRLFPAFGHACLGCGQGAAQTQAHLHFSAGYGHEHQDTLAVMLYAAGEELLPDLGDARFTYRGWSTTTLSHNTVVVDGATQRADAQTGGNLTAWFPVANGCGAVEAEGHRSYPVCREYRRALVLVQAPPDHVFVLDIFKVVGGHQHDWIACGSADNDQTATVNAPLRRVADSLAADGRLRIPMTTVEQTSRGLRSEFDQPGEVSQYWANLRQPHVAERSAPWVVDFRPTAPGRAGLRLHLLAPTDGQLHLVEAPSLRRAGSNTAEAERYQMPMVVWRRQGEDLSSRFVAVWEPCPGGESWVADVAVVSSTPEGLAVKVTDREHREWWLLWGEQPTSTVAAGPCRLTGRFGCLACEPGRPAEGHLMAGTLLEGPAGTLDLPPAVALPLQDAGADPAGDWVRFAAGFALPAPTPEWGLLVAPDGSHRGLRLGPLAEDGRLRVPDGLGLRPTPTGWQETCFPHRAFAGPVQLLPLLRRSGPLPPQ